MLTKISQLFFKKDKNVTYPTTFYSPGIYKFFWPFLGNHLVPNSNQHVNVSLCEIEMYVGIERPINRNTNFVITVIVRGSRDLDPPLQHFIEQIATQIRYCFFSRVLDESFGFGKFIHEEEIRWIEYLPTAKVNWRQVNMKWDLDQKSYYDPDWVEIDKPLLN